jgi:hypothetical protein
MADPAQINETGVPAIPSKSKARFLVVSGVAVVVIALVTAILLGVDFSKITRGYTLPPGLPKDIAQERFVKVLKNSTSDPTTYNLAKDAGGTIYQVRSSFNFVTRKSLDENFSLYEGYLKNNDWEITSTTNLPHYKKLEAIKGETSSDKITVTIKKDPSVDREVVELLNIHIGTWSSLNNASPSPAPKPSPTLTPSK